MAWQTAPTVVRAQRRTVGVLFAGQVLGGLATGAGAGLGSLIAYEVTRVESLAGISRIVGALSTALLAVPLATLALRAGRRTALVAGWAGAALGAVLLVASAAWHSLALLMLGMLAFGAASAANLQIRFAAADMAQPARRARTMSLVMWAGTFGSIVGPNLATPGRALGHRLGVPEVAGTYVLAAVSLLLAGGVVAALLRPDPMRVAQEHGESLPTGRKGASLAALSAIWQRPDSRFALVVVVFNQMVMTAVMTLTPVHLTHTGHTLEAVGLTISLHILGMYAFSPLIGALTDRLGARAVILGCLLVNLAAVACCWVAGDDIVLIDVGLFLLGLGWSFGMVAGSALLLDAVDPAHRTPAQGTMDALINVGAAAAAGLAGVVLQVWGYRGLSVASGLLLVPIALGLLRRGTGSVTRAGAR